MTVRTDLDFDMQLSPRIITVQAPSVALNIQDLHDTVTGFQDSIEGSEYPDLISTAGKEDLGGGVSVGLTSTFSNAQVAFETRTTVHETGTVTTPDTTGTILIDGTATFVANGVVRGDLILNETDGSHSTITSVDSEIQVKCLPLAGGVDDQFDSADAYKVFDMVQCSISGGNLVAIDDVGADLNPVFPTFGTQVVRTSSSSATLQELSSIQFASFGGGVTIDVGNITGNATSGTIFPTGTREQPSDNLTDTATIAATRGLSEIDALGNLTIDAGTWDNFQFVGQSRTASTITVDAAASVIGCEYSNATIQGVLDDDTTLTECTLLDITGLNGVVESCILAGTLVLDGAKPLEIIASWGGFDATLIPVVDLNGSGQALAVRDYSGVLQLENKSGPEEVVCDFNTALVRLAASLGGAGEITVRGIGSLLNFGVTAPLDAGFFLRPNRVDNIWRIHGLDTGQPLTITPTSRDVGGLSQTINEAGPIVTVTRTA